MIIAIPAVVSAYIKGIYFILDYFFPDTFPWNSIATISPHNMPIYNILFNKDYKLFNSGTVSMNRKLLSEVNSMFLACKSLMTYLLL